MVFAETAPHYLFLNESMLQGAEAGLRVMSPPLRTPDDSKALLDALGDAEISVTATDHCAFTREQKLSSRDCRKIPMGIPGSEEMASLLYTYGVCEGMFSISRMREMLCSNPAKIFGLYPKKGVLKPGSDGDITIFNPDVKNTIRGTELHSNAGYSAYEGFRTNGRPVITIFRGSVIVDHGNWHGIKGSGEFVRSGTSILFT